MDDALMEMRMQSDEAILFPENDHRITRQPRSEAALTSAMDCERVDAIDRFVQSLINRLQSANVPFCLLRNRNDIPHGLAEHGDIDFLIDTASGTTPVLQLIRSLNLTHVVRRREVVNLYFRIRDDFTLHVDFRDIDPEWLGAPIASSCEIVAGAENDRGIRTASRPHQALVAWLDNVLWGGSFKPRYKNLIVDAAREEPDEMRRLLRRCLGDRVGEQYLDLAVGGRPELSSRLASRTRRAVWCGALRKRPIRTLSGLLDHFWQESSLRLRRRPAGLVVALLGPDGAGKTAVSDRISSLPNGSLPVSRTITHHLYRHVLPEPAELLRAGRRPSSQQGHLVTDPHGKRAHGTALSTLRMLYTLLDQWLSYGLFECHQVAKNGLVLKDRHMMEVLIDPQRYRFGAPLWLAELFSRLTPPIDLAVLLDAPAEVLQARKQEVPIEESHRQREAYRKLIGAMPNGYIVDAARPIEDVVSSIREIVLGYLANRTNLMLGASPRVH